jgi:hypothetical protein
MPTSLLVARYAERATSKDLWREQGTLRRAANNIA